MHQQLRKQYLLSIRQDFDQSPDIKRRSLSQNIFQLKNAENHIFHEFHGGPKYSTDGEVIQRTIVGRKETFNKLKNQNNISGIKFSSPEISTQDKLVQRFVTRLSTKRLSQVSLKTQSSIKSDKDQQAGKTKRNKDFDIVRREELVNHIKSTAQRIKMNEEMESRKLEQLDLAYRLQETQQNRIMSRFRKQQELWKIQAQKITSHTNRDQNETVFQNSQHYRQKIENGEYQEALKLYQGEQTVSQWYMTLRQPQNDKSRVPSESCCKQNVLQDVNNNFTTLVVDSTLKPLEIIRSSNSFYNPKNKSKSISTQSMNQSKLPFYKHPLLNDIDYLEVEGTNVLKMESEQVYDAFDGTSFRFYKLPKLDDNQI